MLSCTLGYSTHPEIAECNNSTCLELTKFGHVFCEQHPRVNQGAQSCDLLPGSTITVVSPVSLENEAEMTITSNLALSPTASYITTILTVIS